MSGERVPHPHSARGTLGLLVARSLSTWLFARLPPPMPSSLLFLFSFLLSRETVTTPPPPLNPLSFFRFFRFSSLLLSPYRYRLPTANCHVISSRQCMRTRTGYPAASASFARCSLSRASCPVSRVSVLVFSSFPSPSPSLFSLQVSFPSPPPDTGTIVPLAASANVRMPNVMLS